ncbi:uncharacterized protein TNCV_3808511 [Trichonephila clavipes]|nr:uncharacterized protein TNCV_3808511 [Trichonephila clavipes]
MSQRLQNASWLKGVMIWMGITSQSLTKPFEEPNAKIDAKYYQNKVLKRLIKKSKPLYPQGNFALHQDSAPSYTAKSTIKWLKGYKIYFLPPEKWIPLFPDCVHCDYFFMGIFKKQLNRRKLNPPRASKSNQRGS